MTSSSSRPPSERSDEAATATGWREPRTRLSAPERRHQLLAVAGSLFAEHGYHGLSMEQLADAAGVSKPVLYQHFPSKRDLYLGLLRDAVREMEAQVTRALEGSRDNKARVHEAIHAYFDFLEDERFKLVFGTVELADADVRAEVDGANRRMADVVGGLIAADAGLDHDRARFLARAVQAIATEGARFWLEHGALDRDEAVRLLARLSWRGLGSFRPDEEAPEGADARPASPSESEA